MKQAAKYIITVILMLVGFSLIVKLGFLYYNFRICPFPTFEPIKVLLHGLPMDISISTIIAGISWLVCIPAILCPRLPLRKILAPWYMILTFCIAFIYWGDVMLYEVWGFKLNFAVFSYMSSPGEGTASMTWWYIISRALLVLGTMLFLGGGLIWVTPKSMDSVEKESGKAWKTMALTALLALLAASYWFIPQESKLRGQYSECLFLNNATQNPLFTLVGSSVESNKEFHDQFQIMSPEEVTENFQGLYPCTEGITDTLLNRPDPNVLFILLESQSSIFIEELGGIKGITPRQSELIREGILFEQVYATSFRTDRAVVSAMSGHISYPSTSLMLNADIRPKLPSLAKSFSKAGYTTEYIYGGNLGGMQANAYLNAVGYTHQTDMYDLAPKRKAIVSAAPDSLSAQYVFQVIKQKPLDQKWHVAYQTITSHEPFIAPTRTMSNDTLNVFAYTDAAVGRLVDSLKTLPQVWDNLLVVLAPDHGCMFRRNYENHNYFHIPMIWCGGAVSRPGTRISKIMSQSDIAATLLAQLGIPHDDYQWSRNIFSPNYTHPSAYSTWPSGYVFIDETGVTSYDLYSGTIIEGDDTENSDKRARQGRAILQTSYIQLEAIAYPAPGSK